MKRLSIMFAAGLLAIGGLSAAESESGKAKQEATKKKTAECQMACCRMIRDSKGSKAEVSDNDMVMSAEFTTAFKRALREMRAKRGEEFEEFWSGLSASEE